MEQVDTIDRLCSIVSNIHGGYLKLNDAIAELKWIETNKNVIFEAYEKLIHSYTLYIDNLHINKEIQLDSFPIRYNGLCSLNDFLKHIMKSPSPQHIETLSNPITLKRDFNTHKDEQLNMMIGTVRDYISNYESNMAKTLQEYKELLQKYMVIAQKLQDEYMYGKYIYEQTKDSGTQIYLHNFLSKYTLEAYNVMSKIVEYANCVINSLGDKNECAKYMEFVNDIQKHQREISKQKEAKYAYKSKFSPRKLTSLQIREKLIKCATEVYELTKTNHVDDMAIRPELVEFLIYRTQLWWVLNNRDKKIGEDYIRAVVKHTKYIPETEFRRALQTSYSIFEKNITGPDNKMRDYAVILLTSKYGSEWWFLQQLFATVLKGREPTVLIRSNQQTDPDDIMLIDDAIYSGGNIAHTINYFLFGHDRHQDDDTPPKKYTFHIVVPYISSTGYKRLTEEFAHIATLIFYPVDGKITPTFDELEPKIWDDILSIKDVTTSVSIDINFGPTRTSFRDVVEDTLNIEQHSLNVGDIDDERPHTLIYFDHKIADVTSTATDIYENVVPYVPSREPLNRAMECFVRS